MGGVLENLSGAAAARTAGKSAQNIANFNAAVAKQEGVAVKERAKFGQKRQAKRAVKAESALTAKLAAAGGLSSPVAGDILAEQAAESELESLLIGFEGEVAARRAETQAELDKLQGRLSKAKGKAAARAANIRFGTQVATLAGGAALLKRSGSTAVGTPGSGGGLPGLGGRRFLTGFA